MRYGHVRCTRSIGSAREREEAREHRGAHRCQRVVAAEVWGENQRPLSRRPPGSPGSLEEAATRIIKEVSVRASESGNVGNAFTFSDQGRPSSMGTEGNLNVSYPKLRFL